jgi:hypothetical protein
MPKLMRSTSDIEGEDYRTFLAEACKRFASFSLVWRPGLAYDRDRRAVGRDLQGHRLESRQGSCWPGTQKFGGSATVTSYALDRESAKVLARPGSVFSWVSPRYPEDLAFYRKDGQCGFASVAHEELAWILDMQFASALPDSCGFLAETVPDKVYKMFSHVG